MTKTVRFGNCTLHCIVPTKMAHICFSLIFSLLVLFVLSSTTYAQSKSGYHLSKRILVGGERGWDCLTYDVATHRLYVSHSDRVVVVDADSAKIIGEVSKTEGVHGIALANSYNRGFASDGRTGLVSEFDLKTLQVVKEIPVGKRPDAILYDGLTHCVFVCNGESQDISVIDVKQEKVIGTIPVGGVPEYAVTDKKGRVFVNIEDKSEVVAIDVRKLKEIARWPLAPGEERTGLAIDLVNHRLFSVCHNKLMIVMDTDSGKVLTSLPIGSGVDGCAFDPEMGYIFSSNGDGTLTIIKEESPSIFSVVENVTTQRGARTITLDPDTHTLYLPTAEFGPAPEPTAENPRPRPSIIPDTFVILQFKIKR